MTLYKFYNWAKELFAFHWSISLNYALYIAVEQRQLSRHSIISGITSLMSFQSRLADIEFFFSYSNLTFFLLKKESFSIDFCMWQKENLLVCVHWVWRINFRRDCPQVVLALLHQAVALVTELGNLRCTVDRMNCTTCRASERNI